MVYQPDSADLIQDSLQQQTTNLAPSLTAWFDGTANEGFAEAFADGLSNRSQELFHVYLASTLRYAGATITAADCRQLGVDPDAVDLPLINELQSDRDLDLAAADRGVTRNPGAYARGDLLLTLGDAGGSVPPGIEVTAPHPDGPGTHTYLTTEPGEADENATTVTVGVRGIERGPDYNTGSGRLGELVNQPDGGATITSVTNPDPIVGGEAEESNAELRERARGAELEDATLTQRVIAALNSEQTGGGGGITDEDVLIQEFPDPSASGSEHSYPYGNIVIDYQGPADNLVDSDGNPVADLQALVDAERALGIKIFAVSPDVYTLDVTAEIAPREPEQTRATASDIDSAEVENTIIDFLSELALGDDLYAAQLARRALDADADAAYFPTVTLDVVAPDGTTTSVARGGRVSIAPDEKVTSGDVTVTPVANPNDGSGG